MQKTNAGEKNHLSAINVVSLNCVVEGCHCISVDNVVVAAVNLLLFLLGGRVPKLELLTGIHRAPSESNVSW